MLMYLVTQFAWPAIREFHAAVLFEIECGRAHWGDSYTHLESRLLWAATTKCTSSLGSSRQPTAVLFCRDFQSGKCPHSKDHYGMIHSERKWLQHICAKCWTLSRASRDYDYCGSLLTELGLQESHSKAWPPSTCMTCLGVQVNTVEMTLSVTPERLTELELLLSY